MRTGPLAIAGWVVAAILTLGVSWSAMQGVRSAVAPAELSADSLPVPTETAGSSGAAPTTTMPRPSATTPAVVTVTEVGVGGTIRVRCAGGVPEVVSAIPKQGFSADVDDSPGEVKFTSGSHRTEMRTSCAGGQPRVVVEEDDRRGGGDDDNSGPGGGNSGPGDDD